MINQPLSVYINWGAYDELSDNIELTEALGMKQLAELLRLRKAGVRLDGYMMDAFWYDPAGAYRTWRKPHWPQGPDKWLNTCLENGVKPGLWFSGNSLCKLEPAPEWADSFDQNAMAMCMFHGGFMSHWLETLQLWYERGVRIFKLDFFNLPAAPPNVRRRYLPSERRAMNIAALRHGLGSLREKCPEIVILAYNGLEEAETQSRTDIPFHKTVDPHWLDVFDSLYCGDARPADVPAMNFWRSKDVYSDHMVRVYERNGFPLARIDNAGFMIGNAGTCYYRKTEAWQGMLVLSLARGGLMNTYYGNLDLVTPEQAAWFAKAQSMFLDLHAFGRFRTFGGIPGEGRPYGYVAESAQGALITVVNPAQAIESIPLPGGAAGRILFHDGGYTPVLRDGSLSLGAEQMAVVGVGRYDNAAFDLGRQDQVRIPSSINPISAAFASKDNKELTTTLKAPETGCIRVVLRQFDRNWKTARRSSGGSPPAGTTMGKLLCIEADQGGKPVPVRINYDKAIWSGLSWAVAEIDAAALQRGVPINIRCSSKEPLDVELKAEIYHTNYDKA